MKIKLNAKFTLTRPSDGHVFNGYIRHVHGRVFQTYDITLTDQQTDVLTSFDCVSKEWFTMHRYCIRWE